MIIEAKGERYEVELMPDLHGKGWLNRLSCKSLANPGKDEHVVSQRSTTLEWCCDCGKWKFHRNPPACPECRNASKPNHRVCRHLEALGLLHVQDGANPPATIISIIGEVRWYTQQARRFGEVTVAS